MRQSSGCSLLRRERERLVVRDGEDIEAAAAVADCVVGLIQVGDDEFALLGAVGIRADQLDDQHEAMVALRPDGSRWFARQLA